MQLESQSSQQQRSMYILGPLAFPAIVQLVHLEEISMLALNDSESSDLCEAVISSSIEFSNQDAT